MKLTKDTRGVSEVVGAILVFGLVVALIAIIQTQAIPAANEQVEFDHSVEVQDQLIDFHQAAAQTARTGSSDSTKLDLGVSYPNRLLFFNPSPPAGTIRTGESQTIRIENAEAENPTVGKYLNGSSIELSSQNLSYHPNYRVYQSAPVTRYEYGILYNDYEDTQLLVNDGGAIQGHTISLLMPAGELDKTSMRSISVDPRPVSAPANSVSITGDGSGPVTLVLSSGMNKSLWNKAIDTTHVQQIEETPSGDIRIELDPSQTYTLRMARIGVGSDAPEPNATYLYAPTGPQFDIPQGQSRVVNVEVRDRYNNPVSYENITLEVDGPGNIENDVSTGAEGVANARFDAPTNPSQTTIRATLDDNFSDYDPDTDPRDLKLQVLVTQFAGGFGASPQIQELSVSSQCGAEDGNLIDDPIDTISSDDAVVTVNWTVTHNDRDTNMDTVDIRIIRQSNGQVGDTAIYAYDEVVDDGSTQTVEDETGLVDRGQCGSTYDVRVLAQTTGSATDIETEEDVST